MKKRLLAVLMTVCVAATAAVGFTACGEKEEETASGITPIEDIEAAIYKDIDNAVTVGDYNAISVEVEEVVVTDEEVQEAIDADLEYYGEVQQIKEGTVADGDSINIDYVGKIDGVEFEGGSAEATDLTIGSDSFIEGFEDQLIGATIGETKVINVTFPEDYTSTDLAGKAAEFTVTINYKNGETIPAELTDELVAEMGLGDEVTTVDAYKTYMRESLEATAAEEQANAEFGAILEELVKICEVSSFHDDLNKDTLYEEEIAYMEQYAESYSYSYDEFVALYTGMTVEEYEAALVEDIDKYVKRIMIYRAIAKAQGIEVSQEDYEAEVAAYSADYESYGSESVEDFEKEYSSQIYEFMVYDDVEAILREAATVTYTTAAPEATVAATEEPAA